MTICLNMIVKNESPVIKRCLASVKNRIDYWVILDTGSTDGTQFLIQETLQNLPGELHERPWVDFAYNRNIALEMAKGKGDYLLFIDADQVLHFPEGGSWPSLNRDCYMTTVHSDFRSSAQYILLIKNTLQMNWMGALHESLESNAQTFTLLKDIAIISHSDGNRSQDPNKFLKDAQILERALSKDPKNTRNVLFLALSYSAAKDYESALRSFEKRASMGGWDEEIFVSLLEIAHCQRRLGKSPEIFIDSYEKAYRFRPTRAEPLYWLANYFISIHDYERGYAYAKEALSIPLPSLDKINIDFMIYEYEILLQMVRCCYQTGRYSETYEALLKLKGNQQLPKETLTQVEEILPLVERK